MNAQNTQPTVKRESKNKMRVEFDRTPLKERLKAKFLSTYFLTNVVWYIFRLCLLIGIAYVVLFPFITKLNAHIGHSKLLSRFINRNQSDFSVINFLLCAYSSILIHIIVSLLDDHKCCSLTG